MKIQIHDQIGGGLLVLFMLTMALIAGQAESSFRDEASATDVFQLHAGLNIAIDRERLERLESLSIVIATVLDLPIEAELSFDESASPGSDIPDAEQSPVHYD